MAQVELVKACLGLLTIFYIAPFLTLSRSQFGPNGRSTKAGSLALHDRIRPSAQDLHNLHSLQSSDITRDGPRWTLLVSEPPHTTLAGQFRTWRDPLKFQ